MAVKMFGNRGYVKTSMRELAVELGVRLPALQDCFGSKSSLYEACVQFVTDHTLALVAPALKRASETIRDGDLGNATSALEQLIDALVNGHARPGSRTWSRFLERSNRDGVVAGGGMLRDTVCGPIADASANLLALIGGRHTNDDETRVCALLLLGQVHAAHLICDEPSGSMYWSKIDASKIAIIKRQLRENVRAVVRAMTATPVLSTYSQPNFDWPLSV
jgi:AcrR family transcriptional regulator